MRLIKKIIINIKNKFWQPDNIWNMWEYKSWGNSIRWWDYTLGKSEQQTTGQISNPRIRVNDELRTKMESGNIARWRITEVRYCILQKDMFFAKILFIDYLKENNSKET